MTFGRITLIVTSALLAVGIAGPSAGSAATGTGAASLSGQRAAAFTVATGGKAAAFGGFREDFPGSSAQALKDAFGPPTKSIKTAYGCSMRWRPLGLRAELTTYGQDLNPCSEGYFVLAKLTSTSWRTKAGVGPGVRAGKARRSAKRWCTPRRPRCSGMRGYVLGAHLSDCAGGKVPSVIAAVKRRRVTALFVFTHGCE